MTKRRIKEDSSSSEPVIPQQPKIEQLTTPTQNKKIKIEKEEIVDLTGDSEFIDTAEGYDPNWKSSKPASPISTPCKSRYPKYMRPTKHLGATSKSTGSATSSSAASSEESYTYGKKRGRGFLLPEEPSESEDSSEEED